MPVVLAAPCTLNVGMLKLNTCCLVVFTGLASYAYFLQAGHDTLDISCTFSFKEENRVQSTGKKPQTAVGQPHNLCVHACVQEQQLRLRSWLMLSSGRRQCTWERLA